MACFILLFICVLVLSSIHPWVHGLTPLFFGAQTQRLLNAAHDVEADYRSSKWNMIADRLVEYGGGDYTTTFLQRKHLELDFEKQLEKGWGS